MPSTTQETISLHNITETSLADVVT